MNKEQILYEDDDIIVCHKPAGIATQTAKIGQRDMVSEITNYLAAHNTADHVNTSRANACIGGSDIYVGIVHRLDQPVEGILVFGRNQKAANELSRQIVENRMEKYYYAVVSGRELSVKPEQESARRETLTDYLLKDSKSNTSRVVLPETKGAKKAVLEYEILDKRLISAGDFPGKLFGGEDSQSIALVRIKLVTGRHHQIRVQMSRAGMSLLGDYKYADEQTKKLSDALQQSQAALCAYRLAFTHPASGRRMSFQRSPAGSIFQNFSI
ncbi:MAG: RluA family pseudouridine synthase [Lachnospiraceae bacterium]|nr:RluA family pseudouridine synthase [Lachnospiraceae bacterium]